MSSTASLANFACFFQLLRFLHASFFFISAVTRLACAWHCVVEMKIRFDTESHVLEAFPVDFYLPVKFSNFNRLKSDVKDLEPIPSMYTQLVLDILSN